MKHTWKVTFILLLLFFVAHAVGLFVLDSYQTKEYPYGFQPPEIQDTGSTLFNIVFSIAIMTIIVLILIKFRARRLWKFWFFMSLLITLLLSFSAFIPKEYALILALIFALWRILRNNVYLHNFTEMFVYGGLASLFVPILNVLSISILLIAIAIYDYWAVFKSKHMIKMAKFQTQNKVFAGLFIPYKKKTAILGGGDVGFTLVFSGVMFYNFGWIPAIISSLLSGIALLVLLILGRRNKFYPAMPILAGGCFIALGIIYLLLTLGVLSA
ncbi:MAG TPA: presenilin family intramembrane aspartyl protease [Candidatus Nanoarchaeia archaeon]|nr:presenilin family intramembrane aspartyl protease [Candidatus Nanoarchaeia archaeon]